MQMWILAAQFELRQLRLDAARKILGMSLGMCPKDRTYKAYIEVSLPVLQAVLLQSRQLDYALPGYRCIRESFWNS